jgi:ATP-dependent exoDNAse (exonuclease V) alpha subunit
MTKKQEKIKIGDKVKVIGGNYEIGQPTMIGKIGIIESFGSEYTVKDKKTKEVYVKLYGELHCFNDYHLQKL